MVLMWGTFLCDPKLCIFLIHPAHGAFLFLFYSASSACSGTSYAVSHTRVESQREPTLALFRGLLFRPASARLWSLSLQMFVLPQFSRSIKYVLLAIQGLFLGTLKIGTVTHIYVSRL